MAKKLYWRNPEDIQILKDILKKNGLVISSTDTLYGFLTDITYKAFQALCDIKEVARVRPFLILISEDKKLEKVAKFADLSNMPKKTLEFVDACWPGPVTFIFKAKKDVPAFLWSHGGTIALRCPDHVGLQEVLRYFTGLFSTSANKSREPAPRHLAQIRSEILEKVPYIVLDDESYTYGDSSTIVDLSNPDYSQQFPFKITREGAFSPDKLKALYGKK